MDCETGTEDDQESGWFEVRKKHRISPKLSIQKFYGGASNKRHSFPGHYQASKNDKIGRLSTEKQTRYFKGRIRPNPNSNVSSNTLDPTSEDTGQSLELLDKLDDDQLSDHSLTAAVSTIAFTEIKDAIGQENLDNLSKIKRADIEEVSLTVSVTSDSGETKDIKSAHFLSCDCQKQEDRVPVSKPDFFVSPTHALEDNVALENVDRFSDAMLSSDTPEESLVETWRDVSEVTSEYKDITDNKSEDVFRDHKEIHGVSGMQNEVMNDLISEDAFAGDSLTLASPIEGVIEMTIENSPVNPAYTNIRIYESFDINNATLVNTSLNNLPENENNDVKRSADDPTATVYVSTDGPVQGESDHSEGKERFRERLWCFLFENLNRAVDELYLLCELECDKEQMDEAILVLEEAISDFRELKCRVEHFEGTKRFAAQSSKDMSIVKTDHRRPHALSWEVRRMTTSPHKAEILSSSLEAFRKIQSERASKHIAHDRKDLIFPCSTTQSCFGNSTMANEKYLDSQRRRASSESHRKIDAIHGNTIKDQTNYAASNHSSRSCSARGSHLSSEKVLALATGKKEPLGTISEIEKQAFRKDKLLADNRIEKQSSASDMIKRNNSPRAKEKEKDKRNAAPWETMDAWKEKRNWEDILKSPLRSSSRMSCSPGVGRKSVERARVLHDKLMSPEKKKKNALDMRREAEERHSRAMRIRGQLENERLQRLQRASEKLNRVNEWQAVRSLKLREGLNARQQRSESRHEAYLAQVVKRAGDESSKVNEVRFITSLNEENKKLILRQKLYDSELRRAEKIQTIKIKQKEDTAREEAAMERRKLLEAEKMQRLAETQRKKEEAQLRREEERKASSAMREAKAVEQLRRKEIRAKARQEEAELLAQKLAEKLSESEHRRKFYLEQIREKASTDFRDQSSPLFRRSLNKEVPSRHTSNTNVEDNQTSCVPAVGDATPGLPYPMHLQPLKRKIKKIRQRLMALKHDFIEPPFGSENAVVGYRALVGTARMKIGKWLQELQRLCQDRKEGAASIGMIVGDMIKFLEGKDLELHASRQAGLLGFISSALPASHTSKPESCQVTAFLLRLLRVVLSVPANRCYFLSLNLLPPIIPMLSATLDNYIKVAASSIPGTSNLENKMTTDNMDTITEVLDCLLFTVTAIMGYTTNDERELQMQDGLLELIVSYQIIHRLRDFFALYDRPQVEGSPFPSSIMLSLNLLSVLTTRPVSLSRIDWEAGLSNSTSENKSDDSQMLNGNDVVDKFVMNDLSGDNRSPESFQMANVSPSSEFMLTDDSTQMHVKRLLPAGVLFSDMSEMGLKKEFSDVSVGLSRKNAASVAIALSNESHNKLEEKAKSLMDQEDQKITMNSHMGRKKIDELILPCNSERKKEVTSRHHVTFFLSAMAGTGLVSLTSLLTAVLLQANSRLSSDQASYVLPSNFEEAAIGVLKVLNNLACLDISLLQKMLAMSDLRMEFFHLMSFLLSHCTSRWKSANDQVGLLLLESLLLLGYFSLFHAGNQAVLRWGKTPTILHKVCDLPFVFFSDPELTPILACTFVAACYGCEQNRGVIQQELSIDMLLTLLRSCRQNLVTSQFDSSPPDINSAKNSFDTISSAPEVKKIYGDISSKSNRKSVRNVLGKGGSTCTKVAKYRVQRENRGTSICDDWAFKHHLPVSEASFNFMLHRRFPRCFLDKAEEFFAVGTSDLPY